MLRRKSFTAAGLLFVLVPLSPANSQTAGNVNQNAKLKAAEAAASLIAARFHRDLDFKGIFAEDFVSDPTLRSRALDDEGKWKQSDMATRERVYVALMTFLHLWSEYMLVQKQHDVPPEIEKLGEPKLFANGNPPKTTAELDQELSELETRCGLYRKHLPPDVFQSAQYRQSITEVVASAKQQGHNVPRVETGNSKFGIPESVPVYIVRPETFDYYFVEEQGKMKLFYVNIFPNFRLF
jgi:hypothetical protein